MSQSMCGAADIWGAALKKLKAQSQNLYRQWFARISALAVEDGKLVLGVPDDFFRDIVIDNYGDLISEALQDIAGCSYEYELKDGYPAPVIPDEIEDEPPAVQTQKAAAAKNVKAAARPVSPLPMQNIHNHLFENFVVGPSNNYAFAAAQAVAEAPGMNYNPFFLYGTNGVGKTHLLQAIAAEIRQRQPECVVRSVTCDDILNDYYDLLLHRRGSFAEFRASLRDVDVLLIDDIHQLAKKKQMQEEFFNIFNILYRQNKQIVLTSDRQPCEISDLDKRLSSRFEQGMICEVGMLEYEERLVSLRMWRDASLTKPRLPDEFLEFLASNISSNVRRLKGCFLRLSSWFAFSGNANLTIEEAEELLSVQLAEESASRDIHPETIQQVVARHFNISVSDIIGKCRTRQVAEPRMIAMYLCRELTRLSSNEIGSAFGRTHANVLHATKTVAQRCCDEEEVSRAVAQLKHKLQKN